MELSREDCDKAVVAAMQEFDWSILEGKAFDQVLINPDNELAHVIADVRQKLAIPDDSSFSTDYVALMQELLPAGQNGESEPQRGVTVRKVQDGIWKRLSPSIIQAS